MRRIPTLPDPIVADKKVSCCHCIFGGALSLSTRIREQRDIQGEDQRRHVRLLGGDIGGSVSSTNKKATFVVLL